MAFIAKIKAGDFNQRIKLKSISSNQDGFGGDFKHLFCSSYSLGK